MRIKRLNAESHKNLIFHCFRDDLDRKLQAETLARIMAARYRQGFWQGAAKIGNCAALWRSIVRQKRPIVWQIVRQSLLNFKCFGGVLNDVLIGILAYLSDAINISTWNHIFQKKIHTQPSLLRTKLLESIMYKILHINLFTRCV